MIINPYHFVTFISLMYGMHTIEMTHLGPCCLLLCWTSFLTEFCTDHDKFF
jgi:hypothetical protein